MVFGHVCIGSNIVNYVMISDTKIYLNVSDSF